MGGLFGGGGGGGDTTVTQKFEPPAWLVPQWQQYMTNIGTMTGDMSQDPSKYIYGYGQGPEAFVSPLTKEQTSAIGGLQQNATNPWYLTPGFNSLNDIMSNPQANPYMGATNPFGGTTNPEFEKMLAAQTSDITKAYREGTASQLDAAASQANAFGGDAYTAMEAKNAGSLADALAQNEATQRAGQYNQAANIWGSDIARNAGLYQTGVGNQLQAAGMMPAYNASELQNLMSLLAGGDVYQQQGQAELDAVKNLFNQVAQYNPMINDIFGAALSRSSGASAPTSQSTMGPWYSPWTGLLGAGLAGYGMFGGGK